MSRASDIRTHIVAKQPNMTIAQLSNLVSMLHGTVESLSVLRMGNKKPPMEVKVKNVCFELVGNKLHTKEGIIFSAAALEGFKDVLNVMAGPMGLGERTFATLYPPIYNDLIMACANVKEDAAKIVSEVFSGLLKRYQNRTRVGANNDYQFKFRLSTCKNKFITFDLVDMVFDDKDHVEFDMKINDPILQEAIGGFYRVPMPTAKVASEHLARKLKSSFVEVPQSDTMESLIAGLKKYGMETNEIYSLLGIFVTWHRGNEYAGTVVCEDKVSGIFNINFGRTDSNWDEVSIAINDPHKTIILGTKFSGVVIAATHIKTAHQHTYVPVKVRDKLAKAALVLDKEEQSIYHSLVEQELDPNKVNVDRKASPGEKRMIVIDPIVNTGDKDILYRPYALSEGVMMTTLGLVSYKEVMDHLSVTRGLTKSILEDNREVDWTNVITPKVGFWAKVKRLFKAA